VTNDTKKFILYLLGKEQSETLIRFKLRMSVCDGSGQFSKDYKKSIASINKAMLELEDIENDSN
jgi:bacillopeptidase F (M6 metalloprotease family)